MPLQRDTSLNDRAISLVKRMGSGATKEASILDMVKPVVTGARKLWNPNFGNEAFGSEVAKSIRQKGMTFMAPDFGGSGGITAFGNSLLTNTDSFLGRAKKSLGENILSRYIDPQYLGNISKPEYRGWYDLISKKIKDRGFIYNADPTNEISKDFAGVATNSVSPEAQKRLHEIATNKVLESRLFPTTAGKSFHLGSAIKSNKVTNSQELEALLDKRMPNGWVVKPKGGENVAGYNHAYPETPRMVRSENRADLHKIPKDWWDDFIVQENQHLADVNPVLKSLNSKFQNGEWMTGKKEFRVHVVNGKVVPYATRHRGNALLRSVMPWMPFRGKQIREAERVAQKSVDEMALNGKVDPRKNTTFGMDIGIGRDGRGKFIESNPSEVDGASGFLSDNSIQDAISANIAGRLPMMEKAKRVGYGGATLLGAGGLYAGAQNLLSSKEASILSGIKGALPEVMAGARKLWNPNKGNTLFGKGVADAVKRKGMIFMEPNIDPNAIGKSLSRSVDGLYETIAKKINNPRVTKWIDGIKSRTMNPVELEESIRRNPEVLKSKGFLYQQTPVITKDELKAAVPGIKTKTNAPRDYELGASNQLGGDKWFEHTVFPDIAQTRPVSDIMEQNMGNGLTMQQAFDKLHPQGWVLKKNNAGSTLQTMSTDSPDLYISQRGGNFPKITPETQGDWIVQPDVGLAKENRVYRLLDKLLPKGMTERFSGLSEYRVHAVNGKAIDYATMNRGSLVANLIEHILPFRTQKQRAATEFAQQALDNISPVFKKDFKKLTYGMDVGFDRSGKPFLIETNPNSPISTSGWSVHPYVQDAIRAKIKGVLPNYVKARRGIYGGATVAGGGLLANGLLNGDQ